MAARSNNFGYAGGDIPKSWWYLLFGFGLLAVMAIVAAGLFAQYLQNRPINYTQHTAVLAETLEDALVERFVPSSGIHRESTRRQGEGGAAFWDLYRFEVDLSHQLNPEGLKQLIREDMLAHGVTIADITGEDAIAAWSLSRGAIEFARVILKYPQEAPVRQKDLREESSVLAQTVEKTLIGIGVMPETLVRGAPNDREDSEALWSVTRFAVVLPPGLSPGETRARLEQAMAFEGVVIGTESMGYGTLLTIARAGRRHAEIVCTPAPERIAALLPELESGEVRMEIPEPPKEALPTVEEAPPAAGEALPKVEEAPLPAEEAAPIETVAPEPEVPEVEPGPISTPPGPRCQPVARVAIILDDGGNNRAQADQVLALDPGLTLAFLPHTPFCTSMSAQASQRGFEVILHMPMETDGTMSDPGKILTTMTASQIQWNVRDALSQLTGVAGVNNHKGSKFTADRKAMKSFLEVLKEEGRYFIDSWTSDATIAYDVAQEMGVPTAARDVFLDDDRTAPAIQRQFDELIETAKSNGEAIGIGHFQSPHTLALLERELPRLAAKGVELVHASELVK